MNDTSFLGLVQNAALLMAVAFIFDVVAIRWHTGQSSFRQASVGLAIGAIGITIMLTPWTFTPGIVFDTRSVLIGISGLFFGPFSTTIAMAMTAAFRYYLGGTGAWTGVAVILASGVIGIAWRHFRRRPLAEISWRELYLFGMVIHLAMLAIMLTLPWETALRVLSNIALPVLVIYPPGTVLMGALMVNRLRRERAEENLKKKNEELHDMTQQLWQAAKLATMGELSASIAHELNNPLATVSLRVESLLEKTSEDSPDRRELEIIEQEIERMSNLIANLLQFSRRGQPQISTVDVYEEIEKTLELIYYHMRKNNIIIQREFAKDVPHIHADRQQLRQLFLNLFTNASDAMLQGGTLTIRVIVSPEARHIIIDVADTGTGIPPEILSKVTEPFYTTKPEGKGTGLGLAICRRIVQEHQGTFDLTSEGVPGRGTTVRISLPATNGTNAAELK